MRKSLLLRIMCKHIAISRIESDPDYPINRGELLKEVLESYDIATIRRLATYSFGRLTRIRARIVLQYMGHNNPNEENYDDVRINP